MQVRRINHGLMITVNYLWLMHRPILKLEGMYYSLRVKIQVAHWPWLMHRLFQVVYVTIREEDLILAADGVLHYLSNNRALPIGDWVQASSGVYSFQVGLCINEEKSNVDLTVGSSRPTIMQALVIIYA